MRGLRVRLFGRGLGRHKVVQTLLIDTPACTFNLLRSLRQHKRGPRPYAVGAAYTEWLMERLDLSGVYSRFPTDLRRLRDLDAETFSEDQREEQLSECCRHEMTARTLYQNLRDVVFIGEKFDENQWTDEVRILILEAFATARNCKAEVLW